MSFEPLMISSGDLVMSTSLDEDCPCENRAVVSITTHKYLMFVVRNLQLLLVYI